MIPYLTATAIGDLLSTAVRSVNTWAHPHWSIVLFWSDWPLGVPLTPVPYPDYWLPHQQQYLDHPQLPESMRLKYRALQVAEPLAVSPLLGLVQDLYTGFPTLWVGVSRPERYDWQAIPQRALTASSQPRWQFTNATAVFGASQIIITPTASTSIAEFDLADFAHSPYLYPAIADRVRIVLTGIYTAYTVELVNAVGDAITLASEPSDSTLYTIVDHNDSVYAGSWAQSYSASLPSYNEVGHDLQSDGVSQDTMSDTSRRTVWELFRAKSGAKLRITVQQSAPTSYTIDYPIFYHSRTEKPESKCYPETAHTQAVIQSRHLWRFGALEYEVGTEQPSIRANHTSPSVYDTLALHNQLYRGREAQHQIVTDLTARFVQGLEWGTLSDVRLDTRGWLLPFLARATPRAILTNAWRELPPLACLPQQGDGTLYPVGWHQGALVCATARGRLVSSTTAQLDRVEYDAGGSETARTTVSTPADSFGGYSVAEWLFAVTNEEVLRRWDGQPLHSPRYLVRAQGRDLARVTPFWSYSMLVGIPTVLPDVRSVLTVDSRRAWLLWARGNRLDTHHILPYVAWQEQSYDGSIVYLEYDDRLGLDLIARRSPSGTVHIAISGDCGLNLVEVYQVATEALIVIPISPYGVWVVFYRDSGGQVQRVESSDMGISWSAPQTVQLDSSTMLGHPESAGYDSRVQHLLIALRKPDDTRIVAVSTDLGLTFTTILV